MRPSTRAFPVDQTELDAPNSDTTLGVINGAGIELSGWTIDRAQRAVEAIYDTALDVLQLAQAEQIPTALAADRFAEQRLRGGR